MKKSQSQRGTKTRRVCPQVDLLYPLGQMLQSLSKNQHLLIACRNIAISKLRMHQKILLRHLGNKCLVGLSPPLLLLVMKPS